MLYRVVVNDPDLSNPRIEPRLRPLLAAAFRKDPRSRPAAPDLLDYLLPNRGADVPAAPAFQHQALGSTPAPPGRTRRLAAAADGRHPGPAAAVPAAAAPLRAAAGAGLQPAAAPISRRPRRRSGPPPGYRGAGYHQPGQPYPWAPPTAAPAAAAALEARALPPTRRHQ